MRRPPSLVTFLLAMLLLALAGVEASAASGAARSWKKAHRRLRGREAAYWDGFQDRLNAIYMDWTGKRRLWRSDPEGFKDEVLPLEDLRALYDDHAAIRAAAVEIDRKLGTSGAPDAAETLFSALLTLAKEIEATEKTLATGRPVGGRCRYPQEPSVMRRGQALRLEGLIEALAAAPESLAFLAGEGLARAEKGDRRRSTVRRGALLDAVGRIDAVGAAAVIEAHLGRPEPFLRIAALENLVGRGDASRAKLEVLLDDPAPQVRRALLDTVGRRGLPAWLPTLVRRLDGARGMERALVVRALGALSGEDRGNDPASWAAWLEANAASIADGSFRSREALKEDGEAPKEDGEGGDASGGEADEVAEPGGAAVMPPGPPVPAALTFYGVAAPSARVVFVLDGSSNMALPADLELQKLRSKKFWLTTGPKWRRESLDHQALMFEQVERTLLSAPEGARYGVVHVFGSTPSRIGVYGAKRLLEPSRSRAKSLVNKLAKARPAGQLSVEEGLRTALRMTGLDPFENPKKPDETAEILYLLDTGWVSEGRWPLPELVVEAFARENRFQRLTVYAIRIADEKEEAETLMRGLAETTGGTYLWLTTLP